jgi:5-methylcytosine-specific restriction endonuclease McrA
LEGCNDKHEALGYCKKHYRRFKKYGDPLVTPKRKPRIKYEENHKIINGIENKLCGECNEFYPMNSDYFYKNSSSKVDGFNTYCIVCTFERARRWVESNPDKYKEQKLRKVANKTDIQRQRSRDAAKRNREEGYQKKWRQDNPDKIKGYNYNHMHKAHDITDEEWGKCKKYFDYKCAYCGIDEQEAKKSQGQYFHMEHAINTGANDLSNCIPACRSCNSQKWIRDFDEWYNADNKKYDEFRHSKIVKWLESDYKLYIRVNNLI